MAVRELSIARCDLGSKFSRSFGENIAFALCFRFLFRFRITHEREAQTRDEMTRTGEADEVAKNMKKFPFPPRQADVSSSSSLHHCVTDRRRCFRFASTDFSFDGSCPFPFKRHFVPRRRGILVTRTAIAIVLLRKTARFGLLMPSSEFVAPYAARRMRWPRKI